MIRTGELIRRLGKAAQSVFEGFRTPSASGSTLGVEECVSECIFSCTRRAQSKRRPNVLTIAMRLLADSMHQWAVTLVSPISGVSKLGAGNGCLTDRSVATKQAMKLKHGNGSPQ